MSFLMTFHVTLEAILCTKSLLTAITGTEEGFLPSMCPNMCFKVVACSKSLSTAVMLTPKWLFSCVCSNVLPQVAVRCEVFTAAF